jgi:uncharacterized protein involved in exopolysaccharide biosynthesis
MRYAEQTFEATNVIKILDNEKSGFKMPTDAMSIFSNTKVNLENETEVLKSTLLIERVVDSLDLQNTYYVQGNIKETELGSTAPFRLYWADFSEKSDALELTVSIELTPNGYYIGGSKDLKAFGTTYTYKKQPFYVVAKTLDPKKLNGDYKIIKVKKQKAVQWVKLNLMVAPLGKKSELLQITVTAKHPQKAADIANMLAAVFNQDGIQDRQQIHQKTITFVNERFSFLFKELDSIESNKANYKQQENLADFKSDAQGLLLNKSETKGELNAAKTQAVLSEILIETLGKTKSNELLPANIGLEEVKVAAIIDQYTELVLKQQNCCNQWGKTIRQCWN